MHIIPGMSGKVVDGNFDPIPLFKIQQSLVERIKVKGIRMIKVVFAGVEEIETLT